MYDDLLTNDREVKCNIIHVRYTYPQKCIICPWSKAAGGIHDLCDIYNIPISICGNVWQMTLVYDQKLYDIYISMIKQFWTNDLLWQKKRMIFLTFSTCLCVLIHLGQIVHVTITKQRIGADIEVWRIVYWWMCG